MDDVDDSQKAERLYRQEALGNRGQVGRPGWESLTHCIDCGGPIPEKRRLVIQGCLRCLECQAEHDKENCR
jgi:phage/conjugal plasmid C-4 type zinc finger TraR family protein